MGLRAEHRSSFFMLSIKLSHMCSLLQCIALLCGASEQHSLALAFTCTCTCIRLHSPQPGCWLLSYSFLLAFCNNKRGARSPRSPSPSPKFKAYTYHCVLSPACNGHFMLFVSAPPPARPRPRPRAECGVRSTECGVRSAARGATHTHHHHPPPTTHTHT
jgi:hypothetical protein